MSLAETLANAGVNAILGIAVVFSTLVIICLIIYCFKLIPLIEAAFSKKEAPKEKAKEVSVTPAADTSQDNTQLIAVIAAAIAASTGQSTDSFVVQSIKRRG